MSVPKGVFRTRQANVNVAHRHQKIILEDYLAIGDRVIVSNSDDSRTWRSGKLLPDGTVLICVGFYPYVDYTDFGPHYEKTKVRGSYLRYGAAYYKLVNGQVQADPKTEGFMAPKSEEVFHYSAHDLVFEDPQLDPQATRREGYFWNMHREGKRIGDLPKVEFYPGDIVDLPNIVGTKADRYMIESIEYPRHDDSKVSYSVSLQYQGLHTDQFRTFEHDKPVYRTSGRYPYTSAEDIRLVERGNIYRHLHGEPLQFESLEQEASFYTQIGEYLSLRNPSTDNYSWTLEEALRSIRDGTGSVIRVDSGMFGAGPMTSVGHFPDVPELDAKLRAATLAGYAEVLSTLK